MTAVDRARGLRSELSRRGRRLRTSGAPAATVVHCGHHKVGTVWWGNILKAVAAENGLRFQEVGTADVVEPAEVYLFTHTRSFDRKALHERAIRGTHLIRDPRDIVVSGYFYHLWTEELWANRPDPAYDGRTYREQLNHLDRSAGLLLEIERTCTRGQLPEMLAWDYDQPDFLELQYEELVKDEAAVFEHAFRHLGFRDRALEHALGVVESFSFRQVTGRAVGEVGTTSHLRSGQPGEWRQHFEAEHVQRWNELAPHALAVLGYLDEAAGTSAPPGAEAAASTPSSEAEVSG